MTTRPAPTQAGIPVRILPMGDAAILVEMRGIDEVLALTAGLRELKEAQDPALSQVTDLVPAARTVLLVASPVTDLGEVADRVRHLAASTDLDEGAAAHGKTVTIPVRYDGPDLEEVAQLTGLSTREVVAAHTSSAWRVGFGGFAPGFAYLVGGDPRLAVPRRGSPRTSVPAGAVGLAGEYSGIYPRPSPGGWQLIGSTEMVLWDPDQDPPALLEPGDVVHFVAAS